MGVLEQVLGLLLRFIIFTPSKNIKIFLKNGVWLELFLF